MNFSVAYQKSIELLHQCVTSQGFIASLSDKANYKRIWARDSMICSLAALMTADKKLITCVKKSLLTLLKFQHERGEIPSNVNIKQKKVSYGGTAGRIDANLWFLIGFSQYVKRTNDLVFLKKYFSHFESVISMVRYYEFNHKNFIYVPLTGDWADEYVNEGYILYDQALYYRAWCEYADLAKKLRRKTTDIIRKRNKLKKWIRSNYWVGAKQHIYNNTLYQKLKARPFARPYFNPAGYGTQFDGFANSLCLHFGLYPKKEISQLRNYIQTHFTSLIPAFYPPITPKDPQWSDLKQNYSFTFRNKPNEYHNGGLWQMVTGFYATTIPKTEAKKYLEGISKANQIGNWAFCEYVNAKTAKLGGTKKQAWSAAANIMSYQYIYHNKEVFI